MSHVISKFIGPIMYAISQNVGEAMIPKHDNLALTTYTEQLIYSVVIPHKSIFIATLVTLHHIQVKVTGLALC